MIDIFINTYYVQRTIWQKIIHWRQIHQIPGPPLPQQFCRVLWHRREHQPPPNKTKTNHKTYAGTNQVKINRTHAVFFSVKENPKSNKSNRKNLRHKIKNLRNKRRSGVALKNKYPYEMWCFAISLGDLKIILNWG